MHPDSTSADCCPQHEPLPERVKCFLPEICAELKALTCRHNYMFTKRQRIHDLAVPKRRVKRHIQKCACQFRKPVEIIRLEESYAHTRTIQMSYPAVRKLLLFRDENRKKLPQERINFINRLIRVSLLSLYGRLSNVQPPQPKEPIHKWTKEEWKMHTKYLKRLAKHKIPPPRPRMPLRTMPFKSMTRYKKLAKPKTYEVEEKHDWALTPEMKNYEASERLANLAKPKAFDGDSEPRELPIQIPAGALKYKASKRILDLSIPPAKSAGESDLKENPFSISPNALKAKASKRVQELAEPKEYENTHIRDNPQFISPAALKAVASPRIIELAKPKGS